MGEETQVKETSFVESLSHLEDKIRRMTEAVQLVLRENNHLKEEIRNLRAQVEVLKGEVGRRDDSLSVLHREREEVKGRIRKILSMI